MGTLGSRSGGEGDELPFYADVRSLLIEINASDMTLELGLFNCGELCQSISQCHVHVYLAYRRPICWFPDKASEPTTTFVLSGSKTGFLIDTRLFKGTKQLDWAFAGYRSAS